MLLLQILQAMPYSQASAFEIVDERITGNFEYGIMRRASWIACRCVEIDVLHRPTTSEVLVEIKEA